MESRKRRSRMPEANHTKNVRRSEVAQIAPSRIQAYTSESEISQLSDLILYFKYFRDEASSPVSTAHDDSVNTSTTTTPGRPHTGTSLDSSPATSDDESCRDMEAWQSVAAQLAQQMTDIEKKRQEIINGAAVRFVELSVRFHISFLLVELFETEKNHVKILKVLHTVFMVPLEQSKAMTTELIHLVFPPSLLILKDWHNSFEATLKQRWKEHNSLEISDCLSVVS